MRITLYCPQHAARRRYDIMFYIIIIIILPFFACFPCPPHHNNSHSILIKICCCCKNIYIYIFNKRVGTAVETDTPLVCLETLYVLHAYKLSYLETIHRCDDIYSISISENI